MATTTSPSGGSTQRRPLSRIWFNTLIAYVVALAINAILYFVGSALGMMPRSIITPAGVPLGLTEIFVVTTTTMLLAGIVFSILNFLVRRSDLWFVAIAVVVLVISFASPLMLPGAPIGMILLLEIMHIVTAASAIYFLTMRR
ncbi:MAG: DUF6069 family protein [Anaerolineae bacterium]